MANSRCPAFIKQDFKISTKKIKEMMEKDHTGELPEDIFGQCVANCDMDNFTISREMEPQQQFKEVKGKFDKFVPAEIPQIGVKKLKTLEMQQTFIQKTNDYEKYKRMRALRHPNNAFFESAPPQSSKISLNLVDKELLVCVRVYRPIKASTRSLASSMTNAMLRYVQEIHLLGSNNLSQLRDLIKCPGDHQVLKDVSDEVPSLKSEETKSKFVNVKQTKNETALERYKSAFFFIEDTFYNDTRWPDCKDLRYIVKILKWMRFS